MVEGSPAVETASPFVGLSVYREVVEGIEDPRDSFVLMREREIIRSDQKKVRVKVLVEVKSQSFTHSPT